MTHDGRRAKLIKDLEPYSHGIDERKSKQSLLALGKSELWLGSSHISCVTTNISNNRNHLSKETGSLCERMVTPRLRDHILQLLYHQHMVGVAKV